jgi:acetyl esterase/lipase
MPHFDWSIPRPIYSQGSAATDADAPTLTLFRPQKPSGSAMIVLPGGGYQHLADHEGAPIARWLNTLGITVLVLRYRLAPKHRHPTPLNDAKRAIRLVRSKAESLGIAEDKIGILGFSAGGHLASTASTHFDAGQPDSPDPIERAGSRPDVSVLLYPVITFTDVVTHGGSRKNLIGADAPQELIDLLSSEKQVTAQTPPAFLFHTVQDQAVPVENAILYALALKKHGVPFEMHLYEKGPHGVGLAENDPVLSTWPARCAAWLAGKGF